MKKFVLMSLIVGMMTASAAHAELKIAVVDMQKVVQGSAAGKKAKA